MAGSSVLRLHTPAQKGSRTNFALGISACLATTMTVGTVVPTFRVAITAAVTTGTMTVVIIAEITGVVPTGTATAAYGTAAVLSVIHNGLCACREHMI